MIPASLNSPRYPCFDEIVKRTKLRAEKLIHGLGGERARWGDMATMLKGLSITFILLLSLIIESFIIIVVIITTMDMATLLKGLSNIITRH